VYVVVDTKLRANDLLRGSYDPASQWSLRCPIVCSLESAMTTAVGMPRTAFAGKKVKSDSTKVTSMADRVAARKDCQWRYSNFLYLAKATQPPLHRAMPT
jgi:hypothetical protein